MQDINEYIRQHSGLDQRRDYVGLSSIGLCPAKIYDQYQNGVPTTDFHHRKSYQGYMYEREVKKILQATGRFREGSEREITAPFDSRVKGHTDGEDLASDLIEIKRIHPKGFEEAVATGRVSRKIFWQMQGYIRYGHYRKCTIYLVNTEVFEFHSLILYPMKSIQEGIDDKLRLVLRAIDEGIPPACVCGRCV